MYYRRLTDEFSGLINLPLVTTQQTDIIEARGYLIKTAKQIAAVTLASS